jgi:hypothetical protein
MTRFIARFDSDTDKGATEKETSYSQSPNHPTRPDLHGNLSDQLPHRQSGDQSDYFDENGTDFPEPGSNPEHSGQRHT